MEQREDLQSIAAREYAERFPYYNRRRWGVSASKGPSEIVSLIRNHEQQREGLYVLPQEALHDAYTSANFSERLREVMRAGVCDKLVSVDGPAERLLVIHTGLLRQLDSSRDPLAGDVDMQTPHLGPFPYPVSPGDEFTRQQMSFLGAAERTGADAEMSGASLQRSVLEKRYLAYLTASVEQLPATTVDIKQFGYYNHETEAPWETAFLNALNHPSTKTLNFLLGHPDRPRQLHEMPCETLDELGAQYPDPDALQETLRSALETDSPAASLTPREATFFVEDLLHNRASDMVLRLDFETIQQIAVLLRDKADLEHPKSPETLRPLGGAIPRYLREIGAERLSQEITGLDRKTSEQLLHETAIRDPFHDIRSYQKLRAFVIFLNLEMEKAPDTDRLPSNLLQHVRDFSDRYVRLLAERSSINWGIPQNGYPDTGDDYEVTPPMILSATEQMYDCGGHHAVLMYSVTGSGTAEETSATTGGRDSNA